METTEKRRGQPRRGVGLAFWLLILAAFVAFAVYSGMHPDSAHF